MPQPHALRALRNPVLARFFMHSRDVSSFVRCSVESSSGTRGAVIIKVGHDRAPEKKEARAHPELQIVARSFTRPNFHRAMRSLFLLQRRERSIYYGSYAHLLPDAPAECTAAPSFIISRIEITYIPLLASCDPASARSFENLFPAN